MAKTVPRRTLIAAGLAVVLAAGLAAPIHADERDRDHWEHERQEREWHEHEWREHHYAPPPVVYVSPRREYVAPPLVVGVPNGINIVVPLNIR